MGKRWSLTSLILTGMSALGLLAAGCTSAPGVLPTPQPSPGLATVTVTAQPAKSATLAPTSPPLPTGTPTLTSTPTLIPTVTGGSEPLIAFTANDRQGNLNLYIDGFLTGKPEMITRITLPEEDPIPKVRWSPDGSKLAYTNANEKGERWLVVYDLVMNAFQEVYKLPSGRYVHQIEWSEDGTMLTFVTANMRPPGPNLATRRIHLPDLIYLPVEGEKLWINEVSGLNTHAQCFDNRRPVVRDLAKAGYRDLCYFPQLDQYGGLRYGDAGVDFYLFSQDGHEARMLARFPADFSTNGAIDLLLSPNQARLLLVAQPQRRTGSDTERGIPMAIAISVTESHTMTVSADALYYPSRYSKKHPRRTPSVGCTPMAGRRTAGITLLCGYIWILMTRQLSDPWASLPSWMPLLGRIFSFTHFRLT